VSIPVDSLDYLDYPLFMVNAHAGYESRMVAAVRAKLNDPTARLVRWDSRSTGDVPVFATMRPTLARELGLTVSSEADDYGREPQQ
jgi:hypothetical protein